MNDFFKIASFVALAGLGGCASNVVFEGKYAQDEGWRKGTVVEIGPASGLVRPAFYDCRDKSQAGDNKEMYLLVAVRNHGHSHARTAKLPAQSDLKVGDEVYVNLSDCNAPIPKRS